MDPLRQQQISQPIVEVYLAIEHQLLMNIAKRLAQHKTLLTEDEILSWQTMQLSQLGSLKQSNIIAIAKQSRLSIDEISKALELAQYEAAGEFEGSIEEAVKLGLLIKPTIENRNIALEAMLTSYMNQAKEQFNLINTTMLKQSEQVFLDIVNNTVGIVMSGAQTPYQALRSIATKWADVGVPALIDKSGRRWGTEGYVNMVMRSTVNNVANETIETMMDKYDVELVEISSHMGARPKCAKFQGRIFSRKENHPKYPILVNQPTYGDKDSIFGINCRHSQYAYIEGVSKQTYKPYEYLANKRAYIQSQKQRELERNIRKAKRELEMMNVMGDNVGQDKAKEKVLNKQAKMREFIRETNRTRRYNREQIV